MMILCIYVILIICIFLFPFIFRFILLLILLLLLLIIIITFFFFGLILFYCYCTSSCSYPYSHTAVPGWQREPCLLLWHLHSLIQSRSLSAWTTPAPRFQTQGPHEEGTTRAPTQGLWSDPLLGPEGPSTQYLRFLVPKP